MSVYRCCASPDVGHVGAGPAAVPQRAPGLGGAAAARLCGAGQAARAGWDHVCAGASQLQTRGAAAIRPRVQLRRADRRRHPGDGRGGGGESGVC
eukprot:3147073-Rhodomonas_salina.3